MLLVVYGATVTVRTTLSVCLDLRGHHYKFEWQLTGRALTLVLFSDLVYVCLCVCVCARVAA